MAFRHSVKHAVHGLTRAGRTEPNVRLQLAAAVLVCIMGFLVKLTRGEWVMIIIVSGLVIILELINTALEKTLDIVKPRFDDQVAKVKDIMAGAVLIASIMAMVVGGMIFWPHLF